MELILIFAALVVAFIALDAFAVEFGVDSRIGWNDVHSPAHDLSA